MTMARNDAKMHQISERHEISGEGKICEARYSKYALLVARIELLTYDLAQFKRDPENQKELDKMKDIALNEIENSQGSCLTAFLEAFILADLEHSTILLPVFEYLRKKHNWRKASPSTFC